MISSLHTHTNRADNLNQSQTTSTQLLTLCCPGLGLFHLSESPDLAPDMKGAWQFKGHSGQPKQARGIKQYLSLLDKTHTHNQAHMKTGNNFTQNADF